MTYCTFLAPLYEHFTWLVINAYTIIVIISLVVYARDNYFLSNPKITFTHFI